MCISPLIRNCHNSRIKGLLLTFVWQTGQWSPKGPKSPPCQHSLTSPKDPWVLKDPKGTKDPQGPKGLRDIKDLQDPKVPLGPKG